MARVTELTEADHAAVFSMARQLRAKYRMCEFEDIQQELYLWLIKRYAKVEAWREEFHEKSVARLLAKALRNEGERYCRKEKAEIEGYDPEDEFFYSIPMVAEILQMYFDPEWKEPRAIELGTSSSGTPPQEGGNLMVMVADVGKAYEAMPPADQCLLQSIYGGERPVREAVALQALTWEIATSAADLRIRRVLGRLRQKLGGPRPYEEN